MTQLIKPATLAVAALLGLAACGNIDTNNPTTRAVGGGLLGAGAGAAIGGMMGDSSTAAGGALLGGAAGAGAGYLFGPRHSKGTDSTSY